VKVSAIFGHAKEKVYTVGYATTNNATTNERYNEQFLYYFALIFFILYYIFPVDMVMLDVVGLERITPK
jgi:hypothetical protein